MTSEDEDQCDTMYLWFRNTQCSKCQDKIHKLKGNQFMRERITDCDKYYNIFEKNTDERLTDICYSLCDDHDNFRPDSWLEANNKKEIKPLALPSNQKKLQQLFTAKDGSFITICVTDRNRQIIAEDEEYVYFKNTDGKEMKNLKYQRRFQFNDNVQTAFDGKTALTLNPYVKGKVLRNSFLPARHFEFRLQNKGTEKKANDVDFKGKCKIYRGHHAPKCPFWHFGINCPDEPWNWEDKGLKTWSECDNLCHSMREIMHQPPVRGVVLPISYYYWCLKFTFDNAEERKVRM
eukprot:Pgem_evm2s19376